MSLSLHKKHKIYIAARMGFGIGSEDPEELAYYDMVKKESKGKGYKPCYKENWLKSDLRKT